MDTQEILSLSGDDLNWAVARELGWICWEYSRNDNDKFYIIHDPCSKDWISKFFPDATPVSEWPPEAELVLFPIENWASNPAAALSLQVPGWGLFVCESIDISGNGFWRLGVDYPPTAATCTPLVTVKVKDFPDRAIAYATLRSRLYLLIKQAERERTQ